MIATARGPSYEPPDELPTMFVAADGPRDWRTEFAKQRAAYGAAHATAVWRLDAFATRALDVLGAATLLILLSPLLLIVAVLVKLDSPGPVLFRQERVGRSGRPFVCLKFRSMREGADQ